MSVKTNPLHYDNCKNCTSRCENAGKDREFVYSKSSCKVVKKPTRLDRSAWEPCVLCGATDWEYFEYSFCPCCGRPLTETAWEMLEKRLEGARK